MCERRVGQSPGEPELSRVVGLGSNYGFYIFAVDHWIYFRDPGAAQQYRDGAIEFGLDKVRPIELVERQYLVRLKHHGTMLLGDISSMTIPLALKAMEMGGDYDGWQTPVMRSSQQFDPADAFGAADL